MAATRGIQRCVGVCRQVAKSAVSIGLVRIGLVRTGLVGGGFVSGSAQQIVGDPPHPAVVLGAGELQGSVQVRDALEEAGETVAGHRAASAAS